MIWIRTQNKARNMESKLAKVRMERWNLNALARKGLFEKMISSEELKEIGSVVIRGGGPWKGISMCRGLWGRNTTSVLGKQQSSVPGVEMQNAPWFCICIFHLTEVYESWCPFSILNLFTWHSCTDPSNIMSSL